VPVAGSGKKRKAWGKIYGSDVVGGVSNPSSTPEPSSCLNLIQSCCPILILTLFLSMMMILIF
jgi:hypothetical protein